MPLGLTFYKIVKKDKLSVSKFYSHSFSISSAITETITEKKGWVSYFYCYHDF